MHQPADQAPQDPDDRDQQQRQQRQPDRPQGTEPAAFMGLRDGSAHVRLLREREGGHKACVIARQADALVDDVPFEPVVTQNLQQGVGVLDLGGGIAGPVRERVPGAP